MTRTTLLVGLTLVASLSAGAMAMAAVGGEPTVHFNRCDRDLRPCSDPIILGESEDFDGRAEFIGHSSSSGLCLWLDTIRARSASGYGWCGDSPLPPEGEAIWAGSYGTETFYGHRITKVDAALVPEVAAVEVTYRRNGLHKAKDAAVFQVDDGLLDAIDEPEPFGFAELPVRGCIPGRSFRMTAFDSDGDVLGVADRFPRLFDFCDKQAEPGYARVRSSGQPRPRTIAR